VSASQEQTLSGTGARVYTAHRGWLGVVTGISAASTGGVLVHIKDVTCRTVAFDFQHLIIRPRILQLAHTKETKNATERCQAELQNRN